MYYESALRFVLGTFKKCGIPANTVRSSGSLQLWGLSSTQHALDSTPPATVCCISDHLGCSYICLRLPETAQSLLLIGPYLQERPNAHRLLVLAEQLQLSPSTTQELQAYLSAVALLPENSPIHQMLEQFYETLWGVNGYKLRRTQPEPDSAFLLARDIPIKDTPVSAQLLEQRYAMENAMMDAVARGDLQKLERSTARFSPDFLEQRTPDTLRNAKNYSVILNTILRKAAERGGVHPSYIDRVSSDFAIRIEQLNILSQTECLMREMIRSYCLLVKDHNTACYSPLIQRTIVTIDSDLTAELSLRYLAQTLSISGSYLSSLFKKETGQTITAFINSRRIQQAQQLLRGTCLQIQTIAQHCGFPDVNYFSKTFKKLTGLTPKAYRACK